MKSTIIFLGLVALTFTTAKAANNSKCQDLDQQELAALLAENTLKEGQLAFVNHEFSIDSVENTGTETAIFDPNAVIKSTYVKTVEDVIAENRLITESQLETIQPLSLGYTIEDRIAEGNQIIESTVSNEVYALDFEKINRSNKYVKDNSNAIKVSELKL